MLKQLFATFKVLVLALVLSFGLSYALAWTAPTATPPGANVAAPLNAGDTSQIKTGGLTAGSLTTTGLTTTGTLRVTGGAPGLSKVLTSDASGNATWQAAAGGSDNLGNHTATQDLDLGANNIIASGADTTYGATTIQGAKNGWSGINFKNAAGTVSYGTLMMNGTNSGFYNVADNAWRWYANESGNTIQTGTVTASDVYLSGAGRWVSAIPVITKSTTLYQQQSKSTIQCWTDGTKATCTNTCLGALTTAATCSAVTSCASYSCNPATVFANTNLGRLVQ